MPQSEVLGNVLRGRLELLVRLRRASPFARFGDNVVGNYGAPARHEILWTGGPPDVSDALVSVCVDTVRAMVAALVPKRYRAAVLARPSLAWRFPLRVVPYWWSVREAGIAAMLDAPSVVEGSHAIPDAAGPVIPAKIPRPQRSGSFDANGAPIEPFVEGVNFTPAAMLWPEAVSLADVADALRATADPCARLVADIAAELAHAPDGRTQLAKRTLDAGRAAFAWHPWAVAHILDALRTVRSDQRGARMFALPASQLARVPFEVMAEGASYAAGELQALPRGGFRVVWEGKPRGEQLSLGFAVRGVVQHQVFRDIVREMKAEGLRDYVILHRMAAEHGRTGKFRWTWEDHKRATMHERRVSAGNARDDDAKEAAIGRIYKLSTAELHMEVRIGDRWKWQTVGNAPLVNIVGGDGTGSVLEGLELILNPALYGDAGAEEGEFTRYFTQLPEAVLRLPSPYFCLAVMLGFRFRYEHDKGGVVELDAEEIDTYLDSARWREGHKASAAETRHRALDAIARGMGSGCVCEPIEGGKYRITPPHVWVDAVVHRIPPELPPVTRDNPRTGAQLVAWRGARELSQRDAARALLVGFRTLQRAEARPSEPLPRSFRRANWHARPPANDTAPAQQLAPASPVEG